METTDADVQEDAAPAPSTDAAGSPPSDTSLHATQISPEPHGSHSDTQLPLSTITQPAVEVEGFGDDPSNDTGANTSYAQEDAIESIPPVSEVSPTRIELFSFDQSVSEMSHHFQLETNFSLINEYNQPPNTSNIEYSEESVSITRSTKEFSESIHSPASQPPEPSNILPPDNSLLPISYAYDGIVSYIPDTDSAHDHVDAKEYPQEGLSHQSLKDCVNLLKIIKRHPSAWPFLAPVDPVAAGAPTYFTIVKSPMDFGTIEKRLSLVHYTSVEMVLADIQLVLDNCYLFNPPTNNVHTLATHIDKLLEGRIPKIWPALRWRNTAPDDGSDSAITEAELKDCKFLIKTIKLHHSAWPFLAPVDPIALGIPTYFDVVKTPMDFGTIGMKVESHQYENVKSFISDLQLVFDNCYLFNPPEHAVCISAKQVEKYLENQLMKIWPMVKWRGATVMNLGSGSGRAAAAVASIAFKHEASFAAPIEEIKGRRLGGRKIKARRLSSDDLDSYGQPSQKPTKYPVVSKSTRTSSKLSLDTQDTEKSLSRTSSSKAVDISASLALLQQQMAILKGENSSDSRKKKKHKKDESSIRTTQLLASAAAATIAGMVANVKRKHSDEDSSSNSSSSSSSSSSSDSDSESESEVVKMKQLLASFNTIQAQANNAPKKISYAPPPKQCEYCEATSTSTWRRGPSGVGTLCNRCGVKWAKNNRHLFPGNTGSSSSAARKSKKKTKSPSGFVAVTYEQKCQLSSMIESLSDQHQASVIEMIRSSIPVTSGEEIELDIDAIDDVSLRRLFDYVESCMKDNKNVETEQQKAAQRVIEELQRNRGE
ncbi:hypothetical protein BDR26DRAFT_868415 [Obelidium mucronatum]|nr:hypothetical protein BDR26DRAFT_868415 [Obelidium mucronatum]